MSELLGKFSNEILLNLGERSSVYVTPVPLIQAEGLRSGDDSPRRPVPYNGPELGIVVDPDARRVHFCYIGIKPGSTATFSKGPVPHIMVCKADMRPANFWKPGFLDARLALTTAPKPAFSRCRRPKIGLPSHWPPGAPASQPPGRPETGTQKMPLSVAKKEPGGTTPSVASRPGHPLY